MKLNEFIEAQFNNNYIATYSFIKDNIKFVRLAINPLKIDELKQERYQQRNIWLYQSVLLLFLVGVGIYGVFSSIEKIYKLNKQQNNFLLSVTHEFKTPIAAIRLMLQTSKHPKINEDKRSELVDNSIQSTHRLEELAENMLTAMQIESNAYQYNLLTVDYSSLINKVIDNQQIKGDITAHIEPNIKVKGDDFILRMVINNLIENAFKYSNNQPIVVSLETDAKWKKLSIKDQGIGLKKEDFKHIFKKFYRVQDEETRISKGTGLGLFIVKQAVERHSGKVFVRTNNDKGVTFTILLP
jgi:signal transduction histidine kinase